jgi:hypothetical protein
MGLPQHTAAWVLNRQDGIEGLEYVKQLRLPAVGDEEILVQIHAASLNSRDLMITKVRMISPACAEAIPSSFATLHNTVLSSREAQQSWRVRKTSSQDRMAQVWSKLWDPMWLHSPWETMYAHI